MQTKKTNCRGRATWAVLILALAAGTSHGSTVTTPYHHTFTHNDPAATNDFVLGTTPVSDPAWAKWETLSGNHLRNYLMGASAKKVLGGWATLEFSDIGGTASEALNFSLESAIRVYSTDSSLTNRPDAHGGFCVLADNADISQSSHYYARVFFTNVVGNVILSKVVDGVESQLVAMTPTTLTYDRAWWYETKLTGVYDTRANPSLTLTLSVSRNGETNTVELVDPQPLTGRRFGIRNQLVRTNVYFLNNGLKVESWPVVHPGTVIVVK